MVSPYVHLRQIGTPTGNPQTGGQLLYVKSDGYAYTKDASGTEVKIGRAADLTAHAALTTTHGVTGSIVGTTDTQTLTNKTLTSPKVNQILDTDGDPALGILANAGTAVNYAEIRNAAAGAGVSVAAVGSDANINLTIASKGVSQIFFTTSGLNYGGVNFVGAWTAWTPTVTAGSGTFTTVSGAGRYMQIGKSILWACLISITTVGTAAGAVVFTLPVAASATPWSAMHVGAGRENAISGKALQVVRGTTSASVFNYDNTSPIAAGASLLLSGQYEAA